MGAQEDRQPQESQGIPAAAIYVLCALCVQIVASLAIWTVIPVAAGMTPTLILSNSMKPYVSAGDLVLTLPPADAPLDRGRVITFEDPASPGRFLTHRIVERNADGSYDTRGDANSYGDSTPVEHDSIRGVGRVVVPSAGAPLLWARSGLVLPLLGWVAGLALALLYMRAYGRRAAASERPPQEQKPSAEPWLRDPVVRVPGRLRTAVPKVASVTAPALLIIVALLVPRTLVSQAAFATTRDNPHNAFAAGSWCSGGTVTVTSVADTVAAQGAATTNYGTSATTFGIRSRTSAAARSFVSFDLPAIPAGCTVTSAELRLYASSSAPNRTLHADRVAASWTEGGLTWNNQPAITGSAVAILSRGSAGWTTWTVTSAVTSMYTGSNFGFRLSDSSETSKTDLDQLLHPREAANPPPVGDHLRLNLVSRGSGLLLARTTGTLDSPCPVIPAASEQSISRQPSPSFVNRADAISCSASSTTTKVLDRLCGSNPSEVHTGTRGALNEGFSSPIGDRLASEQGEYAGQVAR